MDFTLLSTSFMLSLLIINDNIFVERAEIVREKGTNRSQFFRGMVDKYSWSDVGSSYLPSEFQAAYLWGQLEKINLMGFLSFHEKLDIVVYGADTGDAEGFYQNLCHIR